MDTLNMLFINCHQGNTNKKLNIPVRLTHIKMKRNNTASRNVMEKVVLTHSQWQRHVIQPQQKEKYRRFSIK